MFNGVILAGLTGFGGSLGFGGKRDWALALANQKVRNPQEMVHVTKASGVERTHSQRKIFRVVAYFGSL